MFRGAECPFGQAPDRRLGRVDEECIHVCTQSRRRIYWTLLIRSNTVICTWYVHNSVPSASSAKAAKSPPSSPSPPAYVAAQDPVVKPDKITDPSAVVPAFLSWSSFAVPPWPDKCRPRQGNSTRLSCRHVVLTISTIKITLLRVSNSARNSLATAGGAFNRANALERRQSDLQELSV